MSVMIPLSASSSPSISFPPNTSSPTSSSSPFVSLSERPLDPDDHTFIQTLIGDSHCDIYFKQWVLVKFHSEDSKKRIVVITNFRIFTIKVNLLGRWVRQNFSLITLSKIQMESPDTLCLTFHDNPNVLQLDSPRAVHLLHHILFALHAISHGRPPADSVAIEVPQSALENFIPPSPDVQDGLLAAYLANCDLMEIPQRVSVLDYLMTTFQLEDKSFDLAECIALADKDPTKDIIALSNSLKFSTWFHEIVGTDFPLKDSGLSALSGIFERSTKVSTLVLLNIKAAAKGFSALANALSQGKHSLTFLNVSNNPIGDAVIVKLSDALEQSKSALHTWCLRDVQMSSKGLVQIVSTLSKRDWLQTLKILDISDNKVGKTGTAALSTWLNNEGCQVEQLFAVRCDLDSDILLKSLSSNVSLHSKFLKVLNVSGNKMTKKSLPLLTDLLSKCQSLAHLFLADVDLPKAFFVALLDAAITNQHNVKFTFDFSKNDLGPKGMKEMAILYEKWIKQDADKLTKHSPIHTLLLAENDLGVEGITTLCKSLKGTSINTLVLDNNLKLGLFTNGKEAGESIAQLILGTPNLKELSVAGDDNSRYFKAAAMAPIFSALKEDSCNLTRLDISRNRLADEGISLFSASLSLCTSLHSFGCDANKMTMVGLTDLHKAASLNKSLIDWQIPMGDIQKIFKGSNEKKLKTLRGIVHDFEMFMERNEEIIRKQKGVLQTLAERENPKVSSMPSVISYSPKDSPIEDLPESFSSVFVPGFRHRPSIYQTLHDEPGFLTSSLPGGSSALAHTRTLHRKAASRLFDVLFHKAKTGLEGLLVADGTENIAEEDETKGDDGDETENTEREKDEDDGDDGEEKGSSQMMSPPIAPQAAPQAIAVLLEDSAPNSPARSPKEKPPAEPEGIKMPSFTLNQTETKKNVTENVKPVEEPVAVTLPKVEEKPVEKPIEKPVENPPEIPKSPKVTQQTPQAPQSPQSPQSSQTPQSLQSSQSSKSSQSSPLPPTAQSPQSPQSSQSPLSFPLPAKSMEPLEIEKPADPVVVEVKEKEKSPPPTSLPPSSLPSAASAPPVSILRAASLRKDTSESPFPPSSVFGGTPSPSQSMVSSKPSLLAGGKGSIAVRADSPVAQFTVAVESSGTPATPPPEVAPVPIRSSFRLPSNSTAASNASREAAAQAIAAVSKEAEKVEDVGRDDKKSIPLTAPPPGRPSTFVGAATSTAQTPSVFLDWKEKENSFSYDQLTSAGGNNPPNGVDSSCRELYLSVEDFTERFGMTKEAFIGIPKWKQQAMKSKHQLF